MATEYELKFSADAATQDRIYAAHPGPWVTLHMHTTYYDTPDSVLSRRKWMLRLRLENGRSVCTLKTPGSNGRNEWEVECDRIGDALPMLCKLGAPEVLLTLAQPGLVAVCGASFTRRALTLGSVELALDRGCLFAGARQCPLCEVEVEHKTGLQTDTDRFARALAAQYGLKVLPQSKFKRALALRETL